MPQHSKGLKSFFRDKVRFEYRITLIYILIGGVWILFSDKILYFLIQDVQTLTRLQTFKGWFYVLITAMSFYFIIKNHLQKIRRAENKAKENDRLKTVFLQNISHEIRTPMNGLLGFAKLLKEESVQPDQKLEYLDYVIKSSDQLLSIIHTILDFSIIESGHNTVKKEKVFLNDLLEEIHLTYKSKINKGVSLYLKKGMDDKKSMIWSDPSKIEQILKNLLENASKFTSNGKILFGSELNHEKILFFVQDSGIGIKEEFKEKVFERFFKIENEIHKQYPGTGLGLTICKRDVELLSGKIWFNSELNKGSTFYFTLPYEPAEKEMVNAEVSLPSYRNASVLIVEDEEINYLYAKEILKSINCKIFHARNGKEAIAFCENEQKPSIILMDIRMPELNGYDTLKKIREIFHDIPIIAQTAFVSDEDIYIIKHTGFDGYIFKPYDKEALYSLITKKIKS